MKVFQFLGYAIILVGVIRFILQIIKKR